MKKVIVSNLGSKFVVDDEDYGRVNQHTWNYYPGNIGARIGNKRVNIANFILNRQGSRALMPDHIDRNVFNNRKSNLRIVTNQQNQMNREPQGEGYKGVTKRKTSWEANLQLNGKTCYIGVFKTPEEAAKAYDRKVFKLFGEIAFLNFPWEVA